MCRNITQKSLILVNVCKKKKKNVCAPSTGEEDKCDFNSRPQEGAVSAGN